MPSNAQKYVEVLEEYKKLSGQLDHRYAEQLERLKPKSFVVMRPVREGDLLIDRDLDVAKVNSAGSLILSTYPFELTQDEALGFARWIVAVFGDAPDGKGYTGHG